GIRDLTVTGVQTCALPISFGASFVGVLVGAISGYFGGWIDTVMMRLTDVFLTLPFLPLLLLAADLFGRGHLWVIIAIFIVFSWRSEERRVGKECRSRVAAY